MLEAPRSAIGRRYQLVDQLGSGGMGTVYRAVDRLTGHWVALKRVLSQADQDLANTGDTGVDLRVTLAHEFRLMASLRHPHVVGVLDYGFDGEHLPYYTMDLIDNAQTLLEAGYGQPFEQQITLLVQMLQALAYMHRRGIIHRDLKPKNVLVTGGEVKVLDFGLSLLRGQSNNAVDSTVGTLAYMAPEVLMGGSASEQSDLYAVGVMAYEIFTGRHPYQGDNVVTLLKSVLYGMPDLINLDVDYRVSMVLERLLAKSPEDRYDTAAELIAALGDAVERQLLVETAATRESFLQAARLVGRDYELGLLTQALTEAIQGHGSAWLIGGESGVGKSRLVDEIGTLAMVQGALVLRGQAVDQGSSPYQMWRPALRWLCLLTELNDAEINILEQFIPDLPDLLQREHGEARSERGAQARLLKITESMLRRQPQSVVIILEDLQWAGSESIALLNHLNSVVAGLPLLIIANYRDDERPDLPGTLPSMTSLPLHRLSEQDIAELSEAMLGAAGRSEMVVDLLQRETEGNVFFLIEVVRALAETAGRLEQIGVMTLPEQVFAGGMQRIIERRLNTIPPADRPLLQVAAISGRQFDLNVLRAVAPDIDLERWLSTCSNAAVLEVQDGQWRFVHDKLRNGALLNISDAERRELHRLVASGIEYVYADAPQYSTALSYHWAEAGDHEREAYYAMVAGEQALRGGANREALALFERSLTLTFNIGDASQQGVIVTLRQLIAEAQAALGRYQEAQATYQAALELAEQLRDKGAVAEIYSSMGDVAYALEDFLSAESCYQQSLAIYEAANDLNGVVRALNSLGNVAYDLDDYTKANDLYKRSLALSREIGNQWGMAGSFGDADSVDDEAAT